MQHFECGGTVISNFWSLSAAHCFKNNKIKKVQGVGIFCGENDLTELKTGNLQNLDMKKYRRVQRWIVHEDFNWRKSFQNDIALLKVKSPMQFSQYTLPACLPMKNDCMKPDSLLAVRMV